MGQVTVSLNGRTYRLKCVDGNEQRLFALVEHVRARIETLSEEFGQAGDDHLLLIAALMATDELFALQDQTLQAGPLQDGAQDYAEQVSQYADLPVGHRT